MIDCGLGEPGGYGGDGIQGEPWRLERLKDWQFPGRGDKPIDVQILHAACRSATKATALTKRISVHMLRHSLAAHLLAKWCSYDFL
ncbi:tyrosine-type recombinase/integrase [Sinorhizobium chiapasense]|uniref:tyrosine-type recombinase/integrase n=1 Tax=Sinorhizobium chiapasense TaxID=501572 RepID=UPI002F42C6F7